MKSIKLFVLCIVTGFLFSCTDSLVEVNDVSNPGLDGVMALSDLEIKSLASEDLSEISVDEVLSIVSDFKLAMGESWDEGVVTTRSNAPLKLEVIDKFSVGQSTSVNTRSGEPATVTPVYEVAVEDDENSGIAYVSGDARIAKVIAYIPSAKSTQEIENPLLLEAAKQYLVEEVKSYNQAASLKDNTLMKIAKGLNIPVDYVNSGAIQEYIEKFGRENSEISDLVASRARPQDRPSSTILFAYPRNAPNLCGVKWTQNAPFNMYYPEDYVKIFGTMAEWGNYMAGCAVTAIAQIMAALQPPMTCRGVNINWAYLKENETISVPDYFNPGDPLDKRQMVGALFRDIYDKTKSYPVPGTVTIVNGFFTEQVTGVVNVGTSSSNVYNYFNKESGVTRCNPLQMWDPQVVMESIMAYLPVFVGGNGHAFVIDAFFVCQKTGISTFELVQNYDCYWHANFGWGESSGTGYYLIPRTGYVTFETGEGDYVDTQMQIVPFIRYQL